MRALPCSGFLREWSQSPGCSPGGWRKNRRLLSPFGRPCVKLPWKACVSGCVVRRPDADANGDGRSRRFLCSGSWRRVSSLLALIPLPLIHFWQFQFPISNGLLVRVTRPGIHLPQSPGIQPLLIWVEPDQRGKEPQLFIDSQRISWHDLDSILRKEIVRRPPDWPVYVGGNERLEFGHVARVIDAVRGLRATPALLTRRSALNTGALR